MDDNDLACIDKYLATIRDVVRASTGQVRRVAITWTLLADNSCFPELEITLATGAPEAEEVGADGR